VASLELDAVRVDLVTGAVEGMRSARLTNRELVLLRFLVERTGQVVSRDTLLGEVFGYAPRTLSRAVDKAMDSLRAKVEADKRVPVHLLTVYGQGYRFVPRVGLRAAPGVGDRAGDRFVGRAEERAALRAAIETAGTITLLGPGGAGKTRLAAEVLDRTAGARTCDLTSCRTEADVLGAIEATLGIVTQSGDGACRSAHLALVLRDGGALLVLDNAEHVVDAVRRIVPPLSAHRPVVVTSRVRLDLGRERVIAVDCLPRADAVALFRDRAGPVGADDGAIAGVVDLVDRLPLAIELAARRARVMSVASLAARLARGHAVLGGPGERSGVHAMVAWSWALLDPLHQSALLQSTVFAGGFDLEAAEAVLRLPGGARPVIDVLQSLVDGCLARRRVDGRLDLYETVRQFLRERAAPDPEVVARHGAWYGALAVRLAETVPYDARALDQLERELPNLRAVFDPERGVDPRDKVRARLGVSAWMKVRGAFAEHCAVLDGAVAESRGLDPWLQVRALVARGALSRGQSASALPILDEAWAVARGAGDPDLVLHALLARMQWFRMRRRLDEASAVGEEARAVPATERYLQVSLLLETGATAWDQGDRARGIALTERAVLAARAAGLQSLTAFGCLTLGQLYANTGRGTDARRQHLEALELGRALGSARLESLASIGLAEVAVIGGAWDEVERCATRAQELARPLADRVTARVAAYFLSLRALSRGQDEEAEQHAARGLLDHDGDQPSQSLLELCRAVALARLGRAAEAAEALQTIDGQPWHPGFTLLGWLRPLIGAIVALRLSAGTEAEEAFAELVRLLEEGRADPVKARAPLCAVARAEVERAGRALVLPVPSGMSGPVRAPPACAPRRS
jgi:tetratricopeptide (TPR) repeat protein